MFSPRDRLIAEHTDIARRIALRMARRYPTWVPREDLVAAGMLGLTEAAERYDESRKEPFLSFAEHRIRGAVLDELRRGDVLPRRARKLARRIATAIADLEQSGSRVTDEAVASSLGISLGAYQASLADIQADIAILDGNDVVDEKPSPEAVADARRSMGLVSAALDHLESRDVTILGLHYVQELTYQQIGSTLGVTPTRVCQLLWRAVDRLRSHIDRPQQIAAR